MMFVVVRIGFLCIITRFYVLDRIYPSTLWSRIPKPVLHGAPRYCEVEPDIAFTTKGTNVTPFATVSRLPSSPCALLVFIKFYIISALPSVALWVLSRGD